MNEEETLIAYAIPDNILESKRILGFRKRNWIEGLICAAIFAAIIILIPFVFRVKIIFLIGICIPVILVNLIGIKDQSIFEALGNYIQAKKYKGNYHFRYCTKISSQNKNLVFNTNDDIEDINASNIDKILKRGKGSLTNVKGEIEKKLNIKF